MIASLAFWKKSGYADNGEKQQENLIWWPDRQKDFLKSREIASLPICCIKQNTIQLMKSRTKELKFSFNSICFNSSRVKLIYVSDFFFLHRKSAVPFCHNIEMKGFLLYKENCKNPAEFGLLSTWNRKETGQNCVLTLEFLLCPGFFQTTAKIDTLSLQAAGKPGWAALLAQLFKVNMSLRGDRWTAHSLLTNVNNSTNQKKIYSISLSSCRSNNGHFLDKAELTQFILLNLPYFKAWRF